MSYWFPSSRLARSAFAFLVTTTLTGWSSSAPGSVLLISLPAGEADIQADGEKSVPEVWPWTTPAPQGDAAAEQDGNRPTVKLAPDLSMAEQVELDEIADEVAFDEGAYFPWAASLGAEPSTTGSLLSAISATLTQCDGLQDQVSQIRDVNSDASGDAIDWSFQNRALRLLTFPVSATARNAWGETFARWGQHGSELRETLCDQGVLYRLFRASIEAEQLALIENHEGTEEAAEETRLEPAPTVAASAHLPTAAGPARLRLFILTRPLVRGAAEMLNQAGGSLQNAAEELTRIRDTESVPANDVPAIEEAESSSEAQSSESQSTSLNGIGIPDWNDTTALPNDPAAAEFFGF